LGHGKTVKRSLKLKEPQRLKTVTDDDFSQFFSSTENLQFKCILLLMREGGLRIGEVLGLWLQDIEFHRNGVWVRRRRDLDHEARAKNMRECEQRFVDLSLGLMALLDHLVGLGSLKFAPALAALGYCLHHAKAPKCPYGQNAVSVYQQIVECRIRRRNLRQTDEPPIGLGFHSIIKAESVSFRRRCD
jgi:integrase